MNFSLWSACIFLLIGCSALEKKTVKSEASPHDYVQMYETESRQLVEFLATKKNDQQRINQSALRLIDLAKPILSHWQSKFKQCHNYLQTVVDAGETMQNLDLDTIERDWHEGRALPEADSVCEELKELVVHPSTVIILGKQKGDNLQRMQDEIDEVLVHMDDLKKSL